MFLRIITHLLPRGRAWLITINKQLREFIEGLANALQDARDFFDLIYFDVFPQETRELQKWETQWGLPSAVLTEQERRDRLEAEWSALGGQSPRYIQDTLQGAGFNVFVHEFWEPGTEPIVNVKACVTPRNPNLVLFPTSDAAQLNVECGESFAECGEPEAECGNNLTDRGYPLVNKILRSQFELLVLCGEAFAECGEPKAECGDRTPFEDVPIVYTIPSDPDKFAFFLYLGAPIFGDLATIPQIRRNEFERLCLKICPAQQWLGILVTYI